ncbi:MAG: tRNA epoxyqueuosine(34) reductase QueG [Acidimicrobiia bacterium]|nr:tRNA epoxyqueuosine(34) reductase QueG [Acidimicrobiia bacterium]
MTSRAQIPLPPPKVAVDPADLRRLGLEAGLHAVGFTSAEVLEPARTVLLQRRAAGLNGAMQFTYRNPERSTDPGQLLRGAASMVVGLLGYQRAEPPAPAEPAGRVARYAWDDHYRQLARGLEVMAARLRAGGWSTRMVADSNNLVDRNAAWRAGLAWYGKNTNLLVPGAGSWFVVGVIVTDAPLLSESHGEGDGRVEPLADGCGACAACLDGCPTGALVAPGVLDARRCIAWLVQSADPIPVEYREAVGDRIYGCDACQDPCPENRLRERREPPPPAGETALAWLPVRWILTAGDAALLARVGRWYVANRDPDVIRRTALVVLGNTGRPGDPALEPLLARYLAHPNPLLRSHAVWAARRIGLDQLAARAADDPDPQVRAEVAVPLQVRTPLR